MLYFLVDGYNLRLVAFWGNQIFFKWSHLKYFKIKNEKKFENYIFKFFLLYPDRFFNSLNWICTKEKY